MRLPGTQCACCSFLVLLQMTTVSPLAKYKLVFLVSTMLQRCRNVNARQRMPLAAITPSLRSAGRVPVPCSKPASRVYAHYTGRAHRWSAVPLLQGDQSVGKTSIITRFMYDKFDTTYQVGAALWQREALQSTASTHVHLQLFSVSLQTCCVAAWTVSCTLLCMCTPFQTFRQAGGSWEGSCASVETALPCAVPTLCGCRPPSA